MRSFVRRVLEYSGFDIGECAQAGNGEEALALLQRQWMDVILTDLNMPKMDGVEFLRRLSRDPVLRTVPVLVVSTDRTDRRVQQMFGLGAKGYVKKPFAAETLREELESVLEGNHAG